MVSDASVVGKGIAKFYPVPADIFGLALDDDEYPHIDDILKLGQSSGINTYDGMVRGDSRLPEVPAAPSSSTKTRECNDQAFGERETYIYTGHNL